MKAKCIALQHKVPKEHAASSSDNTQKLVHWSPELVTESTFTSSPHKPRSNPYFSSSSSFSQPPTTFMGELKKMLTEPTGLHVQDRKLIYKKKERDSKSYLDVERVKDGSKLVLLVDIESRKRRLLEMLKIAKKEKTLKSLTEIKVEVDKLAKKVIAPSFTLLISTT
ncbi:BAG family molecular chaperone regulator 1 [Glycine soja]|uniref:BAG family molecular chaperone regulator 1 n=1 Tax=Glycine soja TaxID=3848 RepID=A0A0B2SUE9_GLYSO|nr:BAG family molecular chaperone regulator 1 [Glycine soja]